MSIEPLRRRPPVAHAGATVTSLRPGSEGSAGPVPHRNLGQMCVVVADLADGDAQVLVRNLRRRGSGRVILLAQRASRRELVSLLTGGLRGAIAAESHTSVRTAPVAPSAFAPPHADLTARELGVLRLVADGCSNRAVGERLGLSALTVKSHLARISRKLGTGDRAALVAIAIRTHLLD